MSPRRTDPILRLPAIKPADALPPRLRLNLRQLEVFVATARTGTTRAAAERIARSQSAASAALADLEAALGVPLFDRLGRRLLINDNGRALLPRAAAMLDEAAELQQLFAAGQPSTLRVAASLTIGQFILPALVAEWKRLHPGGPVQVAIANSSDVVDAVAAFDVDIGFIEGPQTHPDLSVVPWLMDELVIVAAPEHPLARRVATPRLLRDAQWALRERGSGTREAADRWLIEHVGPLNVAFELGSPETIVRVLANATALGFLSRHAVAAALAQGALVIVQTRLPRATRRLAIALHRGKRLGAGAEDFVRQCRAATGRPVPRTAPA